MKSKNSYQWLTELPVSKRRMSGLTKEEGGKGNVVPLSKNNEEEYSSMSHFNYFCGVLHPLRDF